MSYQKFIKIKRQVNLIDINQSSKFDENFS